MGPCTFFVSSSYIPLSPEDGSLTDELNEEAFGDDNDMSTSSHDDEDDTDDEAVPEVQSSLNFSVVSDQSESDDGGWLLFRTDV